MESVRKKRDARKFFDEEFSGSEEFSSKILLRRTMVLQHENADGRGKPNIAAHAVDFGGQIVQGLPARCCNGAKGHPERLFQGNAGAVAFQGDRVFDGPPAHSRLAPSRSRLALSACAFAKARSALVWPNFAAFSSPFARASALDLAFRTARRLTISAMSAPWAGHVFGPHYAVEGFGIDVAQGNRLFAQGRAVLVRGFGNLGGRVIADGGGKGSHQHQRFLHQLFDPRGVGGG